MNVSQALAPSWVRGPKLTSRVRAQTGGELWAAHPRGRQGLGYIHDAGGNRHQTGSQFLSLYSGPPLRHLSDAVSRRPHWGTSQHAQPRCLLGYILTMPRIIEEIRHTASTGASVEVRR